jgi:hypothetical protein
MRSLLPLLLVALGACEDNPFDRGPRGGCCGYAVWVTIPHGSCDGLADAGSIDAGSSDAGCMAAGGGCEAAVKAAIECNVPNVCCTTNFEALWCSPGSCYSTGSQATADTTAKAIKAYLDASWPQLVNDTPPVARCQCIVG